MDISGVREALVNFVSYNSRFYYAHRSAINPNHLGGGFLPKPRHHPNYSVIARRLHTVSSCPMPNLNVFPNPVWAWTSHHRVGRRQTRHFPTTLSTYCPGNCCRLFRHQIRTSSKRKGVVQVGWGGDVVQTACGAILTMMQLNVRCPPFPDAFRPIYICLAEIKTVRIGQSASWKLAKRIPHTL